MKASILPLLCFVFAISGAPSESLSAATEPTEQQLIQVLQSNASPREKDAACARLKFIGSAKSVPAVAALLTDTNLSHSARYVLESMAYPEARLALEQALSKTEGLILAGIIHSLVVRGEAASVPALKPLLSHSSDEVAAAAARALGRIGTNPELLFSGFESCKPAAKHARTDGILACGAKLLSEAKLDKAHELFQKLLPLVQDPHLRLAAYRGVLLSVGDAEREQLLLKAISGEDGPEQTAALQVAREAGSESTAQKLCESLQKLQPHVQTALIEALAQRDDPTAAAPIAAFAKTAPAEARLAAIAALGSLGDQNVLSFLAETAASGTPAEKPVARQALVDLRRGNVEPAMVELLSKGRPEIQAEIARRLGHEVTVGPFHCCSLLPGRNPTACVRLRSRP
jgi:HEAT repeat protein